jgi:hypothetical protein
MTLPLPSPDWLGQPPEYLGDAGYGDDGRLRIGSGGEVVEIDMEHSALAAIGIDSTAGIGVYVHRGLFQWVDEIVLSPYEQPSAEQWRAQRRMGSCTREDLLFPPEPPGEYVGTAAYTADGTLRIGSGNQIVTIDMNDRGREAFGGEQPTSIGVYRRRVPFRPVGEVVLSHFRQMSYEEWRSQREAAFRWLEDRADHPSRRPGAGSEEEDHRSSGTVPHVPGVGPDGVQVDPD